MSAERVVRGIAAVAALGLVCAPAAPGGVAWIRGREGQSVLGEMGFHRLEP